MLLQLGMVPGLTGVEVPAVRQAPATKYQLLIVPVPVKSSAKVICAELGPEERAEQQQENRGRNFGVHHRVLLLELV